MPIFKKHYFCNWRGTEIKQMGKMNCHIFKKNYKYPEKIKILILKNICTLMSIAGLFTIGKLWKQSKYPSVDK